MKPTRHLHEAGQSLWLDSISRELLTSGRLRRYIQELSVTGLTSNPTIFDHAIEHSSDYDDDIRKGIEKGGWEAIDDERTIGASTSSGHRPPGAARLAGAGAPRR